MADDRQCYRCQNAAGNPQGVIFVRRQIDGHWQSVPICDGCWEIEQPGRTPVRVLWEH